MRRLRVLIVLLAPLVMAVVGRHAAGDPPLPDANPAAQKPPTPEQAADAVLAAVRAKDDAALKAFAAKDEPDPWLVADELIARGEIGAAEAFSTAAPRKDVEKLHDYVASRRDKPDEKGAREALKAANDALQSGKPEAAADLFSKAKVDTETVVGARLLFGWGLALRRLHSVRPSGETFERAAAAAEKLGWLARGAFAFHEGGGVAYDDFDLATALARYEHELAIERARGDRVHVAGCIGNIGLVYRDQRNYEKALAMQRESIDLLDALGKPLLVATALVNLSGTYRSVGEPEKALESLGRARRIQEAAGDSRGLAATLSQTASIRLDLDEPGEALKLEQRALKIREALGDDRDIAVSLGHLAMALEDLGEGAKALAARERALPLAEKAGDRRGVAWLLADTGASYFGMEQHAKAVEYFDRGYRAFEEVGDKPSAARTLANLGRAYMELGDYPHALSALERALTLKQDLGDADVSSTLVGLANVHCSMGNYAKALGLLDRARGLQAKEKDSIGKASALSSAAAIYIALAEFDRARAAAEEGIRITERLGNKGAMATLLQGLGNAYQGMGDYPAAVAAYRRSIATAEAAGAPMSAAVTRGNLALIHERLGQFPEALRLHLEVLAALEGGKDRVAVAYELANVGETYQALGDFEKGLAYCLRAAALAKEVDSPEPAFAALVGQAGALHDLARDREALEPARAAVELVRRMATGLADEQGARTRTRLVDAFEVGVTAAVALDDAGEAWSFLESGRAGTLLESLNAKDSLHVATLSPELRRAEVEARGRESEARVAHHRAVLSGDTAKTDATAQELAASGAALSAVVERIQREAKAAASILYPRTAPLPEVQRALAPGDALVVYGLMRRESVALVVTAKAARLVSLGPTKEIEDACAGLVVDTGDAEVRARVDALRRLVVAPLGLGGKVTRLLVSPDGALAYAPLALLTGNREIAYLPSGTTYALLLEERSLRGEGVLALGDPDYGSRAGGVVGGIALRGPRLDPLPGTREEVKAVGSVVLLGADATARRLSEAVAAKPRWHGIHLACHGFLDAEQPSRSSLALSAEAGGDGLLTALDVCRMRFPADLVILSACETGRGKVFRGEGIMGLTRSFMLAGAPRVICSLWKVDDGATQVLMRKFYALWNPKDGSTGLGAAAALQQAQAFVRDYEEEAIDPVASRAEGHDVTAKRKPYSAARFWAGWVLWGLPD